MRRVAGGRGLSTLGVIAALIVPVTAGAQPEAASVNVGPTANKQQYVDGLGDVASGGMDIKLVTVSNNDAGLLTFSIEVPSHERLPTNKSVAVYLDTDLNPSTGDGGSEYELHGIGSTNTIRIGKWNGSSYERLSNTGITGNFLRGETITINRSVMGYPVGFNLEAYTYHHVDGRRTVDDRAPNTGFWRYDVVLGSSPPPGPTPPPPTPTPKPKVRITDFTLTPRPAVAGKSLEASVAVDLTGTSRRFDGSVSCQAKAGTQTLRWFANARSGGATCRWDIPESANGRRVSGWIWVEQGGSSARRTFSTEVVQQLARVTKVLTKSGSGGTKPTAGEPFTYAAAFRDRQTGKQLSTGTTACRATATRGASTSTVRVKSADVTTLDGVPLFFCRLRAIPRSYRGGQLRVELTVRSAGTIAAASSYASRIR
jgi:hypothetical protein